MDRRALFYDFEVARGMATRSAKDSRHLCNLRQLVERPARTWPAGGFLHAVALEYFVTSSAQLARFHVTSEK
jgi:hypothetical protein